MSFQMPFQELEEITKNLESFLVKDYEKLDTFLIENPGLTPEECSNKIKFHKFTAKSLMFFIKQVNENRLTFNAMGPYRKTEGKLYYAGKVKREDRIELVSRLTSKLEEYEKKFGKL